MKKNKWIIKGVVGVMLFGAVSAWGHPDKSSKPTDSVVHSPQNHAVQLSGATPLIFTPAQLANEHEKNRLDDAGAVALDAGDYAEAEDDARQSIAIGPDSGIAQEVLAAALNAQGKKQEALQAYKAMADVGGDQPRNLLPYALLLLKAGQWAQAVAAYNKAQPFAYGELMAANSHFSPTVAQPKDLETAIHIALALTYASSGSWGRHSQTDKALSEHRQALALEPNSALANYYYGYTLQHLGRPAQAQAYLKKAAALGSDDVKAAAQKEIR